MMQLEYSGKTPMLDLFYAIDVRSLLLVLMLGNLVSAALVAAYRYTALSNGSDHLSLYLLLAKSFQGISYYFLLQRNNISGFLSVNFGNTLLFVGFYFEALSMLAIFNDSRTKLPRVLLAILIGCITAFNFAEQIFPNSSFRVVVASLCIFSILLLPNLKMMLAPNQGRFPKVSGLCYLVFLVLLLPRAIYAMSNSISILSNFFIQQMTFLTLVLLLIYSLPAYLLVVKEKNDKVIRKIASTDYLTKLPNRFSFLEVTENIFSRCRKKQSLVALIFMDIDYFKYTNDKYGHNFGDKVLVSLANVLQHNLRDGDLSCRYGGEEFVVFLHGADLPIIQKIAHRIMDGVSSAEFSDYPRFSYTISMGIAYGIPTEDMPLSGLIEIADKTMYVAKNNGRNRIEYTNITPPPEPTQQLTA
jgi:diguanylate cyclase (GGDEF) domain